LAERPASRPIDRSQCQDPFRLLPGPCELAELAQAPGRLACQRSLIEPADPGRTLSRQDSVQGLLSLKQQASAGGRLTPRRVRTRLQGHQARGKLRISRPFLQLSGTDTSQLHGLIWVADMEGHMAHAGQDVRPQL
jgi:hypothetical protein